METIKTKISKNVVCEALHYNSTKVLLKVTNNKSNRLVQSLITKSNGFENNIDSELNRLIIESY